MAVTCQTVLQHTFTGDVVGVETPPVAANAVSPGTITLLSATVGFNALAVPLAGAVPTGITIIPPAGNTNALTLKGVTGDTGIRIHNTNPTYVGLDPSVTTLGITVATATTNLRIIWS